MTFKLQTSPTFWCNVKLTATAEDGKSIEGEVRICFHRKRLDEAQAIAKDLFGKAVTAAAVALLIAEWQGYEDENGAVPFSQEALERLVQFTPNAPLAIANAFFKANAGA